MKTKNKKTIAMLITTMVAITIAAQVKELGQDPCHTVLDIRQFTPHGRTCDQVGAACAYKEWTPPLRDCSWPVLPPGHVKKNIMCRHIPGVRRINQEWSGTCANDGGGVNRCINNLRAVGDEMVEHRNQDDLWDCPKYANVNTRNIKKKKALPPMDIILVSR